MTRRFAILTTLTIILTGLLSSIQIHPVEASASIYIRSDGSIEPFDAPIVSSANVIYTFTGNITESIIVERSNIVVDGEGHTVRGSGMGNGISLSNIDNVTIRNVTIENFGTGIYLGASSDNTLVSNTLTQNGDGVDVLDGSDFNTISGNNITNNAWYGIGLLGSSTNSILQNSIIGNWVGIGFYDASNNNQVSGNQITGSTLDAIFVGWSASNTFHGNVINKNKYSLQVLGDELAHYLHAIDVSNLVDGKPIYYLMHQRDLIVNPATHPQIGFLALVNCSDVRVESLTLAEKAWGLFLAYTQNSTLTGNDFTHNLVGVMFDSSLNNTVYGNNITDNEIGVELAGSVNNTIHGNNFIENGEHVHIQTPDDANVWDDGYSSGGNYWSTFPVEDRYSGPNQDEPGSDGISDTPYVITTANIDNYPLAIPTYAEVSYFNLSITAEEGGTTDPESGTYRFISTTQITATAIPNPGYSFDYWLRDGEEATANPTTILMNADHTLVALFVDDIPPDIDAPVQDPPVVIQPFQSVVVTVNITDLGTGVKNATLWYTLTRTTWTPVNMMEHTPSIYQATIPGHENCTWIEYRIIAYDINGNQAINDNQGNYYVYHVIPEFPPHIILFLFIIVTLLTVLTRLYRKPPFKQTRATHARNPTIQVAQHL